MFHSISLGTINEGINKNAKNISLFICFMNVYLPLEMMNSCSAKYFFSALYITQYSLSMDYLAHMKTIKNLNFCGLQRFSTKSKVVWDIIHPKMRAITLLFQISMTVGVFILKIIKYLMCPLWWEFLPEPYLFFHDISFLHRLLACIEFRQVLLTLVEKFIMLIRSSARTHHIYTCYFYTRSMQKHAIHLSTW